MNDTDYVLGVLRTEAPVTESLTKRFHSSNALGQLLVAMSAGIEAGDQLDTMKKYLFYGRQPITGDINATIVGCDGTAVEHEVSPSIKSRLTPQVIRLLHSAIGIITEGAEMLDQLAEHIFDDKELDLVNLVEELGDNMWYVGVGSNALYISLEDIKAKNNAKLKARYPHKFTEDKAIVRDLPQERAILESKD